MTVVAPTSTRVVAGVVLAGGASRRMGTDKALIDVAGRPMVLRVASALAQAGCSPVWCQGGDVASIRSLGLAVVADSNPGQGPVVAIRDALRHSADHQDGVDIVVAACDLVDLTAEAVRIVIDPRLSDAIVTAAVANGESHLLARWSAASLPRLDWLVAEGVRSYRGALRMLHAREVGVPPAAVRNLNRPADLDIREADSLASTMSIQEITVDELAELIVDGIRLIDVREPSEYDEAHVPEATPIPLGTVPDNVDAFRGDGPTYVICKSGGRSMKACEFVAAEGIDVVNITGGTMAWIMSGRHTATGTA